MIALSIEPDAGIEVMVRLGMCRSEDRQRQLAAVQQFYSVTEEIIGVA